MENLNDKAKEIQREYQRKWRKENKEKVSIINKNYWIRKAQKEQEGEK